MWTRVRSVKLPLNLYSRRKLSRRSVGAVGTVNGAVARKQVWTGADVQSSAQHGAFGIEVDS